MLNKISQLKALRVVTTIHRRHMHSITKRLEALEADPFSMDINTSKLEQDIKHSRYLFAVLVRLTGVKQKDIAPYFEVSATRIGQLTWAGMNMLRRGWGTKYRRTLWAIDALLSQSLEKQYPIPPKQIEATIHHAYNLLNFLDGLIALRGHSDGLPLLLLTAQRIADPNLNTDVGAMPVLKAKIELAQFKLDMLHKEVTGNNDYASAAKYILELQNTGRELRDLHMYLGYCQGISQPNLGEIYGLTQARVYQIVNQQHRATSQLRKLLDK